MATTRRTWFGVVVEFDNTESNQLIAQINTGAATASALAAALTAMGVVGASVVAAIVSGILWIGSASLGICNASQRGLFLYVPWTGTPWCRTR